MKEILLTEKEVVFLVLLYFHDETNVIYEPRTTQFVNEHLTNQPVWLNSLAIVYKLSKCGFESRSNKYNVLKISV